MTSNDTPTNLTEPDNTAQPYLSIDSLSLSYQDRLILSAVSFTLNKGDIACLLGPSGSGKSTLLRSIAGFHAIDAGSINLGGRCLSANNASQSVFIEPEVRNVGMVFQDNALFPHLNVLKNVMFGLHGQAREKAETVAQTWITRVGLRGRESAMPFELSGGEQQRVALARALAPEPDLVLLDEPFSNLDVDLRESLGREVREIFKASKTTALLVTHDQQEAFSMADCLGVLNDKRLQQWGSAYDVYHEPNNRFIAEFLGRGVLIKGVVNDHVMVETVLGVFPLELKNQQDQWQQDDVVEVLLRPDDVIHNDDSALQVKVKSKLFRGAEFLYLLELENGEEVLSLVPSHHDHHIGEMIGIDLAIEHVVVFAKE